MKALARAAEAKAAGVKALRDYEQGKYDLPANVTLQFVEVHHQAA